MPDGNPSSAPPSPADDVYAWYGRRLMQKRNPRVISTPIPIPTNAPPAATASPTEEGCATGGPSKDVTGPNDPVGILGAGPGGLYAALILTDLGIPFQVLESSARVGGRLFTYTFPNPLGAPYNYYDVGAMRFPQTDAMNRVFNLFGYGPLNTPDIALGQKLTPYYFGNDNCLMDYNGITKTIAQTKTPGDHFNSAAVGVGSAYIAAGADTIEKDALAPFVDKILQDLKTGGDEGWNYLMKFDKYSFRAYLSLAYKPTISIPPEPLPTDVVNWMETFNNSTGAYDRALSESVLDAIAFGWPDSDKIKWWCLNGGAVQIADAMYKYLVKVNPPNAIIFGQRADSIAYAGPNQVVVGVGGIARTYSNVISTIPLPVLRTLYLSNAGLSPMQSNALRELDYGPSVKVGMQFATAWWTTGKTISGQPLNIVGGQSYTDRPLRTIVYPSFGNALQGQTTTLIASYTWTADATRLAALVERDPKRLENLVLVQLAEIHNVDVGFLQDQLIASFPWSWDNNIDTMGAFAYFQPGKFEDLYHSLSLPAGNGYIQFAGEALSTRHAWVEGAFDSAWRAIASMLMTNPQWESKRRQFLTNWGTNPEWVTPAPKKPTPGAPHAPEKPAEHAIFDKERSLLYRHIAGNAEHWQL